MRKLEFCEMSGINGGMDVILKPTNLTESVIILILCAVLGGDVTAEGCTFHL